jgi:hypothetical protein
VYDEKLEENTATDLGEEIVNAFLEVRFAQQLTGWGRWDDYADFITSDEFQDMDYKQIINGTESQEDGEEKDDDSIKEEIISENSEIETIRDMFEKYDIEFYEEENIEYYPESKLPQPETLICSFPKAEKSDDMYIYEFDTEEECRVYSAAYILYLMHLKFSIEEYDGLYIVDESSALGIVNENGNPSFVVIANI